MILKQFFYVIRCGVAVFSVGTDFEGAAILWGAVWIVRRRLPVIRRVAMPLFRR